MTVLTEDPATNDGLHQIGRRLRELRAIHGRALREVAADVGLTVGFLSRLERGQTNISIVNLKRLADYYGISVRDLFDDDQPGAFVTRNGQRADLSGGGDGLTLETLTPRASPRLEVVVVRAAGGHSDVDPYPHEADEVTFVLEGKVTFRLGDEHFTLRRHDAIFVPKGTAHTWENASTDQPCVLLTAATPATL